MRLTWDFNIYSDIIQIYNNKEVGFYNNNFFNIILKTGQNIRRPKKYNLIFKIFVSRLKNSLLFIIFLNFLFDNKY